MDAILEFIAKIPPVIPQIVGITGTVLYILCFQLKHRIGIILMNATSRVLFVVQYCLLGAFEGAIFDVLGIIISFIATKKDKGFIKKYTVPIIIASNALIIAAGVFCYVDFLSIFPVIGVMLHTSAFFLTDEKKIRRLSLAGSPFWFVYNTASKAYGSSVGDVLSMVSIISAMVRYRKMSASIASEGSESKTYQIEP